MKGYYDHRKAFNLMWSFRRYGHLGIMYKEYGVQVWWGYDTRFKLYHPGKRYSLTLSLKERPKIEILQVRRELIGNG